MKLILRAVIISIFLLPAIAFSQPSLKVTPDSMEFENIFNRLENAFFINEGDDLLKIDSIVYNNNLYYVRFDYQYSYPLYIEPGDTIKMDCILAGYYNILPSDTLDTLLIYSNSRNGAEAIDIKIAYWDDEYKAGTINGHITDSIFSPISGAKVHFFFEGNYIVKTATTNNDGFYSLNLPPGSYTVAAEKDSYYVTYFGQKFDPLNAEFIPLENDSVVTADIIMPREINSSNSVSGLIFDSLSGTPLKRAVVIVRNGSHSPTKINHLKNSITPDVYTVIVSDSGFYKVNNIVNPGYYYIQSFSDYFVPSYYNLTKTSKIFWQEADSVFIGSDVNNLNIFMPRDSSLGGGSASGIVVSSTGNAGNTSDVIVYAQDADNYISVFNYAFTSNDGYFKVPFLPYGDYRLIGQKIGFNDAFSSYFTIDSNNTNITGLKISLVPASQYDNPDIPGNHIIIKNYPNPFNPSTRIEFSLPYNSEIELNIFNILGEKVKSLWKETLLSGNYEINFNAAGLTSGAYFVILKTQQEVKALKVLLLR